MKKAAHRLSVLGMAVAMAAMSGSANAGSVTQALKTGKAYGNINMRYESVEQDGKQDGDAMTLRTRIGYKTGSANGFSALVEFEDSRSIFGQDDYSLPAPGGNTAFQDAYPEQTGGKGIIADPPENTELDQAFVQYKNEWVTAKFGPQVITLDGHRFVGHVGWRQDRQTFDAFSAVFTPNKELTITAAHIFERNRIFGDVMDVDSNDFLFNVGYKSPIGKISAYSYNLEVDGLTGVDPSRDTYGISLNGNYKSDAVKFLYSLEYASQEFDNDAGVERDADYTKIELGAVVEGITMKIGQETLGSDDGLYGFTTELATLHKFNGWADMFLVTPTQGLVDTYLMASAKLGPGKLTAFYHDFEADKSAPGIDDFGSEIDVAYGIKFNKVYSAGVKYADYSAKDIKADTTRMWLWVSASF